MKRILLGMSIVLVVLAGAIYWQRMQLFSWYCATRLASATDEERALWAERVAQLDADAAPWLLGHLQSADAKVCANVEAALALLARNWASDDARCQNLIADLKLGFPHFSSAGKQSALRFPLELVKKEDGKALSGALALGAGKLLEMALQHSTGDPAAALKLALHLSERAPEGQWQDICRSVAICGLQDAKAANRVLAIHLALNQRFAEDHALLSKIAPLLQDTDGRVRRAALVAVGMSKDLAAEEELLPLLHDDDTEVRRLCKVALRSRGLSDDDLVRAVLISDARANVRLDVFNHLHGDNQVEPDVWLRRLSQDASPAIRAAAIRMAYAQGRTQLCERIRQMARDDASPTVRQLAAHYLGRFGQLSN